MSSKITILISTRNRFRKLSDTLESIRHSSILGVKIVIMCDGDAFTHDALKTKWKEVESHLVAHGGSVASRNRGLEYCEGSIIYLTDDVILPQLFLDVLRDEFEEKFETTDGVLGIRQVQDHHESGIAMVGEKFLRRYPEGQLFYPGYYHFAAQEIARYARSCRLFGIATKTPPVEHRHPGFFKEEMDTTHVEARVHSQRDHVLMSARQGSGLIWPVR